MKELLERVVEEMKKMGGVEITGVEYSSYPRYAATDWNSNKIFINPRSFGEFERKGMSKEEILRAYLQHEYLGHRCLHPFDVARLTVEDLTLAEIIDADNFETSCGILEILDFECNTTVIANRFDDIVANLKVWNLFGGEELLTLYKNLKTECTFDVIEKMFYQDVLGEDFGIYTEELQPYVDKLKEIDFLSGSPVKSISECREQIKQFYEITKPVWEAENKPCKWVCKVLRIIL